MDTIWQLDMSDLSSTTELVVINEERTKGSDLLLTVQIKDAVCESTDFHDPVDNDFRGPGSNFHWISSYPDLTASKFNPDAPVFALLPDGGYAPHDYRLELDENTIENPLMDGGGGKVLATAVASQNRES
jgi:hypothetical protein